MRRAWYLAIAWLWAFDVCTAQTNGSASPPSVNPELPSQPKVPSFVYFRCNTTSWNLDTKSRMQPSGLDGVYTLRLEIKEDTVKNGGDSCIFTATATEGVWDEQKLCFGITVKQLEIAAGKAGIASIDLTQKEASIFHVKYARQGVYQAFLNLNEPPSLLIAPEGGEGPPLPLP